MNNDAVITRLIGAIAALLLALFLGVGVAQAAPQKAPTTPHSAPKVAPKKSAPTKQTPRVKNVTPKKSVPKSFGCMFAQNMGSSQLGGPGCNPLTLIGRAGPYASEDFCTNDKARWYGRRNGAQVRTVKCAQYSNGFWYAQIYADLG